VDTAQSIFSIRTSSPLLFGNFSQATNNGVLYGGRAENQVKIAGILGLWGEFLRGDRKSVV
jgi:hypothetical protein